MTAPFAGVLRGITPSKLRYAHIVENWRPYFAALMAKSRELGSKDLKRKARELERLGFNARAPLALLTIVVGLANGTVSAM